MALIFQVVDPADGLDKFRFLNFKFKPEITDPTNPCFGTSGVSVTHLAGTDTWVFEAGATDVACLQAQPLGGSTVREFRGKYIMPFKITAVRKESAFASLRFSLASSAEDRGAIH